jgi:glutathione peroxidase
MAFLSSLVFAGEEVANQKNVSPVLNFKMKNIDGKDVFLGEYQGKVLLIVNVASECGFTPQYEELEKLHQKYQKQGLKVLAFPANDFGSQEPGTNEQIKEFCQSKYDVTFDLFAKTSVKGNDQCDLYKLLTDKEKNGQFGGEIRWNFQKFLVDRNGKVVERFEPKDDPMGDKIVKAVEKALQEQHKPGSGSAGGKG